MPAIHTRQYITESIMNEFLLYFGYGKALTAYFTWAEIMPILVSTKQRHHASYTHTYRVPYRDNNTKRSLWLR